MSAVKVKIYYSKRMSLSIKDKSFIDAMKLVWRAEPFKDYIPIKLVFESTGKVLHMHKNSFEAFLDGVMTMQELCEATECFDLVRNKNYLNVPEQEPIEPGALWKLQKDFLVLVSDDQYITSPYTVDLFETAV